MNDPRATESEPERRRMSVWDELLLALLPTATVLLMIALIESLGRHHLLCASLASSALLIYLDPEHQTNAVRTLILSQMTAAGVGFTGAGSLSFDAALGWSFSGAWGVLAVLVGGLGAAAVLGTRKGEEVAEAAATEEETEQRRAA